MKEPVAGPEAGEKGVGQGRSRLMMRHAAFDQAASEMSVPVTVTGVARPVSFDPAFLADALEMAPVLWISDSVSPGVARREYGLFCVVMPMRTLDEPVPIAEPQGEEADNREPAPAKETAVA